MPGDDEEVATAVEHDDAPTRVPPAPVGTSGRHTTGDPATDATQWTLTPIETLRIEEIQRTRVFLRICIGVSVVVMAATPFMHGHPLSALLLICSLLAIVGTFGWLSWRIREDSGYTEGRVLFAAMCSVVAVFGGIQYFGVFSPAPVIIPFGLYFFSLSQNFRSTLVVLAMCTAGYLALALATMAGLVGAEYSIVSSEAATLDKLMMVALVETVFIATFALGRATRRASLQAVEKHDAAVRRLSQREALLREARQELELALNVGGVGRYTDVVLGSYRLGVVIGRGGMGEVYEALHVDHGEAAAVKVLQRHLLADPDNVRRFIREARIVEQLEADNVVRVFEVGDLDAPTPYIAMERLRGMDLAEKLRGRRQLSLRRTLELARDVGRGLESARDAGIIHRDIKPRNLFHAQQGNGQRRWKILDFGVSKLAGSQHTVTRGGLVGTPGYMAPEQASGGEVTYRSDLYSLGVICYRALTGRPAFTGHAVADLVYKVAHKMPPRPSAANPMLDPALDDVLMIAIAKDPADRFANAFELVAALEDVARHKLDVALRARATRLSLKHPWGSEVIAPADDDVTLRERSTPGL